MIDAHLITSARHDASFLLKGTGPVCFAIVHGENPVDFVQVLNRYNPLRVRFTLHTIGCVSLVEMPYSSELQQRYFTFAFWLFSKRGHWVHLWDTLEHDVFRRDFDESPAHMDLSLSINRLWLKNGKVHLVNRGYTDDNPHGELVAELTLDDALECLERGEYGLAEPLQKAVEAEFAKPEYTLHFFSLAKDVEVYVPRDLQRLIGENPHVISNVDGEINLAALASVVDLNDEVPMRVAVVGSDAENLSLGIKVHCQLLLNGKAPEKGTSEPLDSQYMQRQLKEYGLLEEVVPVEVVQTKRDERDWSIPFRIEPNKPDFQKYLALFQDDLERDSVSDLTLRFRRQLGADLPDENDPAELSALHDLEDFEDFVEFYAQEYMGFSKQDLEGFVQEPGVDWDAYNDDSDYSD